MGNFKSQMSLKEFYNSFEKLIVPLEFLARNYYNYNHHLLFNKQKYNNVYESMSNNDLINIIIKSFNEFEKYLKSIIYSSDYKSNLLFRDWEIKGYIENLILWKQGCSKYKKYFERLEDLLNKIKLKDLEMSQIKRENEEFNSYNNECNYKDKEKIQNNQQQQLIDKQKVIQAQELALLNDNFGRALASLECYANRISGKKISNTFNYYDMFNLGNTQDLVELQKKAFVQTQIFNLAYEDYINNYGKYDIPENINILQINNLLNKWMLNVPNEHKTMYQGMINTLNSLNNDIFNNKFKLYSEQYKNATLDPTKIASFAPGVYYYNQQRCQEAKDEFLEEGKLTSKLNINKTYKSDKKAEELQKQILTNNKNYIEREEYKDFK